jgi:lipopolysaccharide/colanic/teichoic acid biosynthesis glycosyltransferase
MIDAADEQRAQVLSPRANENLEAYLTDNRITGVGKILRRWSIDETPQFIHVLFGTMSIVGPRPILFEELVDVPPSTTMRFVVKPGLTGIWQVSGRKSVLWNERMRQDLKYIETWSLLGDVRLILKTVGAVFTGRGAV